MTIDSDDIEERIEFLDAPDATIMRLKQGLVFPEDVIFHNQNDEWLYAYGQQTGHIWRTADNELNHWELVK